MKKKLLFELIWLVCILILSIFIAVFAPGNAPMDINAHDTFIMGIGGAFPFSPYFYIASIFLVLTFFLYFIRALYTGFKVSFYTWGLLISTGVLIFSFSNIVSIATLMPGIFRINDRPDIPVTGLFYGGSFRAGYALVFDVLKIVLILTFAFAAFMIGRNWKKAQS